MTQSDVAWVVAIGGWGVALLQFYLGYSERREQREEQLLAQTLSYFEGKTQRRSIGISMVEGIWAPKLKMLDVIVPVLLNQAVYLLLSSNSKDAVHEERNLIRLLILLDRCIPYTSCSCDYYTEIIDALDRKDHGGDSKGIPLSRATTRAWYEKFGGDIEAFDEEHPERDLAGDAPVFCVSRNRQDD